MLVHPVGLGHVLVAEESPVGNISGVDGHGEEKEGEDTFPGLDATVGDGAQDDVEPDVGKDGPGGSHDEDTQVLDLPDLIIGNDIHAETNDHEEIESGGSDNGTGSQITSLEVLGPDFNDRQHDLGSR